MLIENSKGVPLYLGRTTRIATPGQTIALAARDRGCSFPGCDRPPSHCQRHHITDWANGGPTDIDNLTLLCGYHHREHAKRGWECVMLERATALATTRLARPHTEHPSATPDTSPCPPTNPTDQRSDADQPGADPSVAPDVGVATGVGFETTCGTPSGTTFGTTSQTKGNDQDIAVPEGWLPDTG